MTAIPETFRAFVAERRGDGAFSAVSASLSRRPTCRKASVDVRVDWSSVNYKDALATIAEGKVARINPLIPGIDLAGEVVASRDPVVRARRRGAGPRLRPRGRASRRLRRVHAAARRLRRAAAGRLDARDAMAIGTAGFTAAMSVAALEERGLAPGDGPVLVTGASGGVGGNAVAILGAARPRGLGGDRQSGTRSHDSVRSARPGSCRATR